ncbi:siroheme synthase [Bacillus sp. BRMEA1]|uniref:precorrin-2 dehydrogenase/sirohydrochlorin ferrochelatase family protein n=1 Tax=Neobacillus endophyticus TaxID=2738405 RepID=UPI001566B720|nr:NAD(P)-dependent oxidoreductase [Neobacillus endophyticus]NRD77702.1 siroheme synthase [Neobacillus endophyticus]
MNPYYPIMLRLEGKKALVVGGGKVAERKVTGLLEAGAIITVISPDVTEGLRLLANEGKVIWQPKEFSPSDVKDALLIFAATSDKRANRLVKASAQPHQLVTMADGLDTSDFHVPSKLKRGQLIIAVSTGGASPTLARRIRAMLEEQFDPSYEDYLEFLFSKRLWILKNVEEASLKRKLLTAIASKVFLTSCKREEDFMKIYNDLIEADS